MRFLRLLVTEAWEPVLIVEQEVPMERLAVMQQGVPLRAVDIGLFYDCDHEHDGAPCGFAAMVWAKFAALAAEVGNEEAISALMTGNVPGLPRYVECPVSVSGLRDRIRRSGSGAVPAVARAWLQWMLPPGHRAAIGLSGSLSPQVAKALERNRRGLPQDFDQPGQLLRLERAVQARSDRRSAIALARRQADKQRAVKALSREGSNGNRLPR